MARTLGQLRCGQCRTAFWLQPGRVGRATRALPRVRGGAREHGSGAMPVGRVRARRQSARARDVGLAPSVLPGALPQGPVPLGQAFLSSFEHAEVEGIAYAAARVSNPHGGHGVYVLLAALPRSRPVEGWNAAPAGLWTLRHTGISSWEGAPAAFALARLAHLLRAEPPRGPGGRHAFSRTNACRRQGTTATRHTVVPLPSAHSVQTRARQ